MTCIAYTYGHVSKDTEYMYSFVHLCTSSATLVKGDHRKLKINRLTLDYVFLNKYTIKMKHTHFF